MHSLHIRRNSSSERNAFLHCITDELTFLSLNESALYYVYNTAIPEFQQFLLRVAKILYRFESKYVQLAQNIWYG